VEGVPELGRRIAVTVQTIDSIARRASSRPNTWVVGRPQEVPAQRPGWSDLRPYLVKANGQCRCAAPVV